MFWGCVFFLFAMNIASADVTLAPVVADLPQILQLIEAREGNLSTPKSTISLEDLSIKDDDVTFHSCTSSPCDANSKDLRATTTFQIKSKTIKKRIHLKRKGQDVTFTATLMRPDKAYEFQIYPSERGDVLIFSNKREVFVYTQSTTESGVIELKEWIYARTPNGPQGSEYVWQFRPDIWGWPMSLEKQGKEEDVALYRNMPINGIPYADKKERARVVNSVGKIAAQYKMYFPHHEKIANIPPVVYWNNEGMMLKGTTVVANEGKDANEKKPKKGPDWRFRYSLENNMFKVFVNAKKEEYPLLIDPTLQFEQIEHGKSHK